MISGFGGAALGAIVGGAISLLLARQASSETLARDRAQRLDAEHASALNVLLITTELTNRAYRSHRALLESLALPGKVPAFAKVRAHVQTTRPAPRFSPVDFIPFIKADATDAAHECTVLADKVDTLEKAFEEYNSQRRQWEDFARRHTKIDSDGMAVTDFTEDADVNEAGLRGKSMDDLIELLLRLSAEATQDGQRISAALQAAYRRYFGNREGMIRIVLATTPE